MTNIFEHTDTDEDKLEVCAWRGRDGYMFRIKAADQRRGQLGVYLTLDAAADLAEALRPAVTTTLPVADNFAPVVRAEYTHGDLSVTVEGAPGNTPKQVAKALRRLLVDVTADSDEAAVAFVAELAEILDVDETDVLDAARGAKQTILDQDQRIGQLITEAETTREMVERIAKDRDARLTQAESRRLHEQLVRIAKDRDARLTQAESRRLHEQLVAAERKAGDLAVLRKMLMAAGLHAMSILKPEAMVETIKGLGDENNSLREALAAENVLLAKQTMAAQAEEIGTWRASAKAAAAEADRLRADGRRLTDEARRLRTALTDVRAQFVNADTEEVEAADLSSGQAALIVAKIDRALKA